MVVLPKHLHPLPLYPLHLFCTVKTVYLEMRLLLLLKVDVATVAASGRTRVVALKVVLAIIVGPHRLGPKRLLLPPRCCQ